MAEQKKESRVKVVLLSVDIGNRELGSVPNAKSFDLYQKLVNGVTQSKCRKVTLSLETPLDKNEKSVLCVRAVLCDGPCCVPKGSAECDCVRTLGANRCPDHGMQTLMNIIKEHTK